MIKLNKTEARNLEILMDNGGACKADELYGKGSAIRGMADKGLATRHVWGSSYVYQITAKGRDAFRSN